VAHDGVRTSFYSRHKADAERALDEVEIANPLLRVVRLRPGIIGKREAGTEIRRLFAGPLLPSILVRPGLVPVVPDTPGLRFQVVHASDVAEAYRLAALTESARGAYNVATDPVLDPDVLAQTLGARKVPVPASVLRAAASLTWKARLQPTPPGWLDLGLGVPIMDTQRIRSELGWAPSTRRRTRCSSCWRVCANRPGSRPRRSTLPRAGACGYASCSPAWALAVADRLPPDDCG
jgi:nucleoside-diphosphate-sugar epimerase